MIEKWVVRNITSTILYLNNIKVVLRPVSLTVNHDVDLVSATKKSVYELERNGEILDAFNSKKIITIERIENTPIVDLNKKDNNVDLKNVFDEIKNLVTLTQKKAAEVSVQNNLSLDDVAKLLDEKLKNISNKSSENKEESVEDHSEEQMRREFIKDIIMKSKPSQQTEMKSFGSSKKEISEDNDDFTDLIDF